mgnify:CR=1 FL=1
MNVNFSLEIFDRGLSEYKSSINDINTYFDKIDDMLRAIDEGVITSKTGDKVLEYVKNIREVIPLYRNKFKEYITYLEQIKEQYKNNEMSRNRVYDNINENYSMF